MKTIEFSAVDQMVLRGVSQPKLSRLGFAWDDVEEVIPVTFPATMIFLKDLPNPVTRILTYSHGDSMRLKSAIRGTLQS